MSLSPSPQDQFAAARPDTDSLTDQDVDLQEFFDSTQHKIKTPEVSGWSQAL